MSTEIIFRLNMVLGVLEDCFGRMPLTMPEILSRISEEDIKFYYKHFKRLGVIRDGRTNKLFARTGGRVGNIAADIIVPSVNGSHPRGI